MLFQVCQNITLAKEELDNVAVPRKFTFKFQARSGSKKHVQLLLIKGKKHKKLIVHLCQMKWSRGWKCVVVFVPTQFVFHDGPGHKSPKVPHKEAQKYIHLNSFQCLLYYTRNSEVRFETIDQPRKTVSINDSEVVKMKLKSFGENQVNVFQLETLNKSLYLQLSNLTLTFTGTFFEGCSHGGISIYETDHFLGYVEETISYCVNKTRQVRHNFSAGSELILISYGYEHYSDVIAELTVTTSICEGIHIDYPKFQKVCTRVGKSIQSDTSILTLSVPQKQAPRVHQDVHGKTIPGLENTAKLYFTSTKQNSCIIIQSYKPIEIVDERYAADFQTEVGISVIIKGTLQPENPQTEFVALLNTASNSYLRHFGGDTTDFVFVNRSFPKNTVSTHIDVRNNKTGFVVLQMFYKTSYCTHAQKINQYRFHPTAFLGNSKLIVRINYSEQAQNTKSLFLNIAQPQTICRLHLEEERISSQILHLQIDKIRDISLPETIGKLQYDLPITRSSYPYNFLGFLTTERTLMGCLFKTNYYSIGLPIYKTIFNKVEYDKEVLYYPEFKRNPTITFTASQPENLTLNYCWLASVSKNRNSKAHFRLFVREVSYTWGKASTFCSSIGGKLPRLFDQNDNFHVAQTILNGIVEKSQNEDKMVLYPVLGVFIGAKQNVKKLLILVQISCFHL